MRLVYPVWHLPTQFSPPVPGLKNLICIKIRLSIQLYVDRARGASMPVQNAEIAEMFDQTAELLEIKGDNPFRSRAYRNAARMIERLPKSITSPEGG